jgi:Flp pilus assembly CpaE family ATPase
MRSYVRGIGRRWRYSWGSRGAGNGAEHYVDGLSFHSTPGPVLAVAGLTGGAGASVLAYLIAVTAARESSVPVLVVDSGGPTGGLAAHAGVSTPQTLGDIAERITAEEPIRGTIWVSAEHGLRVIAGVPQFTVDAHKDAVLRVLTDAHEAHGLTVVDAGTLARSAGQTALSAATHVAWTLIANEDSVIRARRVLERIAPLSRPELLIARADPATRRPPISALANLADERRAPLILMPSIGQSSQGESDALIERAQQALQALGGVLAR